MLPLENYALLLLAVWILSVYLLRFAGTLGVMLFLWTSFSAVNVFKSPFSIYHLETPGVSGTLDMAAMDAMLSLLTVIAITCLCPMKTLLKALKMIALVQAFYMFYNPWGFFENASMSGCFQAVILPFFFIEGFTISGILVAASVLVSARHMPIGILIVESLLYAFR